MKAVPVPSPSLLLLIAFLAALPARALEGHLPPPTIPDCLGVNIHFNGDPARDLDAIRAAGFRFVRMDVCWQKVESQKGVHDFKAYDELTDATAARGIRILYILCYGKPKPAYEQMQRLVAALKGMRFEKRLPSKPNDHVLLFAGAGKQMLAAWTGGADHEAEVVPD